MALEGPGSLSMNLMPRIRHRNQYQKTPGGERVIRRGLSLSSHDDGDSKLSGDLSPGGAGTLPQDPFGLLGAPPKRTCSKDNSFVDDAPEDDTTNQKSLGGKMSFESVSRFAALSRSISADERLGACHRGVKSHGVAGAVGALASLRDADTASPFGDGEERFATEPRRATVQRENELPASSLESRADSDYCSQHSKDFVNLGCAPFV